MALELAEVVEQVETMNKNWLGLTDEYKKVAAGATADHDKVARLESSVDAADAKNQAFIAAQEAKTAEREAKDKLREARIEELEKKLARRDLGTGGAGSEFEDRKAEHKAAFDAYLRYGHPDGARQRVETEAKWAKYREMKGLSKLEWKVLTLGDDTGGGYLSTPEYVDEIIMAEVLFSPMRSICTVFPTGTSDVFWPKRTGVASATWVGEVQTRPESTNPTYGLVKIPTHELVAKVPVSRANAEDSRFPIQTLLTTEFSQQFAVSEGNSIVVGNGENKPMGFTDASQAVATTGTGGATIASATGAQGDAIVSLTYAVKSAYAQNGRFVLARPTLGSVRKLQDNNKRYIWEPSLAAGQPSTILQYPYTEVPDMPLEGAGKTPIGFGDWKRAYVIVDRLDMPVMRDDLTLWDQGQVKFAARRRVGGQVVLAEAIRLLVCT